MRVPTILIRAAATLMMVATTCVPGAGADEIMTSQHEKPACDHLVSDLTRKIAAIEPTAAEDKWRTVPWRIDLMAARAEAAREHKPIFLWLMNGHPMGCT